MTDYKQEIEDCYCVCHFASSSKPSCEHCYGYNEVGITNNSNITIPATALTHLINKAKVEELKRLKAIDAFNEAYTLDPRPAKLVDMRIKELQEGREG